MVKCKHVNKIITFTLGTAALFLTAIGSFPDRIPAQENENPEPVVEYVTSDVEIIWDDSDNQDGIRPNSLNVFLTSNGVNTDNGVLSSDNGWSCSFNAQPKFDNNGMENVFSVNIENMPDNCGYTLSDPVVSYNEGCHFTITASHETEKRNLSARIAWIDEDNIDGIRPDAVTFSLYANGSLTDSRTASSENTAGPYSGPLPSSSDNGVITGSGESNIVKNNADNFGQYLTNGQDSWEISFGEHPVNQNGHPIMYSIRADGVDGYDLKPVFTTEYGYSFPGAFFAAVHEPAPKTGVTVSMIWNDSDNADQIRPVSVHATLIADGSEEIASFDLSEDNNWICTAENIIPVNTDGSERSLSLTTDTAPDGYSYSVDRNDSENSLAFTITGIHARTAEPDPADSSHPDPAPKISVTLSMVWNDSEDIDRLRPSSVHASLIADGNGEAAGFILSENSSWTLTIDNMM